MKPIPVIKIIPKNPAALAPKAPANGGSETPPAGGAPTGETSS